MRVDNLNRRIIFCVFFVAVSALGVFAEEKLPKKKAGITRRLQLGVDAWQTGGSGEWEIRFVDYMPSGIPVTGRSILEWKKQDSLVWVMNGELKITDWLYLAGRYGSGDIRNGNSTDTDYVNALGFRFVMSESVAESDGDVNIYDADLHLVLSAFPPLNAFKARTDIFIGYQHYTDELVDRNGVQTVIWDEQVSEPFPEPAGYNSTYDFEWRSVRLGMRSEYPLTRQLSVSGSLSLSPFVNYNGEGYWVLRDDFRQDGPSFKHSDSSGLGIDTSLAFSYLTTCDIGICAGYRLVYFGSSNGEDKTYFSDGTVSEVDLERVASLRDGFFVGVFGEL
ncbi:hypothetical protein ACFLS1_01625 [Verrucomicrobiota bacterium]